jgi:hypothetical protein
MHFPVTETSKFYFISEQQLRMYGLPRCPQCDYHATLTIGECGNRGVDANGIAELAYSMKCSKCGLAFHIQTTYRMQVGLPFWWAIVWRTEANVEAKRITSIYNPLTDFVKRWLPRACWITAGIQIAWACELASNFKKIK